MKEFIEKLIGRLEARKKIILSHKIIDAEDESMIFAYNETINIINELAKEYINTSTDTSTTNADKIRSMTDEELAEFLLKVNTAYAEPCMIGEKDCKWEDYPTHDKGCKDCFLDWLQSEVEGVTENE